MSTNTSTKFTPVLLLTGYLGSGKTTLLNRILTNRRGIRFAVIVNDLGEVNIDSELIQRGGIVGSKGQGDLVALQNGCICCTLQSDLVEQLRDLLATGRFDYIVIEASGICEPEPIARTICSMATMADDYTRNTAPRLDCIATVVDALRLKDEFGCGLNLTAPERSDDIESLIIDQIEFCNIILLNKASEVTPEELAEIKAVIRALQPKAEIIECDYCDVDLDKLVNTNSFDYGQTIGSATWVAELENRDHNHDDHDDDDDDEHHHHHHDDDDDEHERHHHHHCHHDHEHGEHCHCHEHGEAVEYGISTFVYFRRDPFDINKLDRFIATQWPKEIIRSKGIMYFAHNRDMSFLFETAGRQKKLSEAGLWYATAAEEELTAMMIAEPELAGDWDPVYGDRMVKLVFIGRGIDRERLTADLDACLDRTWDSLNGEAHE